MGDRAFINAILAIIQIQSKGVFSEITGMSLDEAIKGKHLE